MPGGPAVGDAWEIIYPTWAISHGQLIWAMVPRLGVAQTFFLVGLDGAAKQNPKPLPKSVGPLLNWIQSITKNVGKEKLSSINGAKPVNCWLPIPFATFAKNLSSAPASTVGSGVKQAETKTEEGRSERAQPTDGDNNSSFEPAKTLVDSPPEFRSGLDTKDLQVFIL